MKEVFKKKIIFYLGGFALLISVLPSMASAAVLLPGNIATCGELAAPGTYTLTGNVDGGASTCFTISSDNVTIDGGGFTLTGTGAVAIDARKRSGEGTALVEGGNGFTNLIINNVDIIGYTTGINTSGNDDTTGNGVNNGFAGDAGDVSIFYSLIGDVVADGGDATTKGYGGLGGNITFTDIDLDISSSDLSALGGSGTSGDNTDGGLDLNYTGTLTRTGVTLSQFSYFNNNTTEYGSYVGGTWPIEPGNVSACGTLFGAGTYTLTDNLESDDTCFLIGSNNVTINGAGYSITSEDASSTAFAINAGSFASTTVASTTITDYTNLITSSSTVIISGNNLDISDKTIYASALTISYTGTFTAENTTVSELTSLIINGVSYGSHPAGILFSFSPISITTPTASSTVNSFTWNPVIEWDRFGVNPDSCLYSYDDFTSTSTAECDEDGADVLPPINSGTSTLSIKMIDDGVVTSTSTTFFYTQWRSGGVSGVFNTGSAMSATGQYIYQADINSAFYKSSNYGLSSSSYYPSSKANVPFVSSDGSIVFLPMTTNNGEGNVLRSTDYGSTWTTTTLSGQHRQNIDGSSDGKYIITAGGDSIYGRGSSANYITVSSDYGTTWSTVTTTGTKLWSGVASSANGKYMAASVNGGYIYTTDDYGVTWATSTNSGSRAWRGGIAMSADGSKIAGVVNSGYIYISDDGGDTWDERAQSIGAQPWRSIDISADGEVLIATGQDGNNSNNDAKVYMSYNGGVTWEETGYGVFSTGDWMTVTISADGSRAFLGETFGGSRNYYNPARISVDILRPSEDDVITYWDPFVSFGNATSTCEYSWNNSDWDEIDCANNGSDIPVPDGTGSHTLYVRGTNYSGVSDSDSKTFDYQGGLYGSICTEINAPGTFTLLNNLETASSTCLTVNVDGVTVDGNGFTITATSTPNSAYAITVDSDVDDVTLEDVVVSGFGGGIINAASSSVTIDSDDIDLSNSTTTADVLTLTYTNTLTAVNTYFSNLSSLIIDSINLWNFSQGLFSWDEQDISACGTISDPGYYNLTQNISDVSGTCFVITDSPVIIDGNGFTISGAGGNTSYAITATSTYDSGTELGGEGLSNIGIRDLTVTGFGGVVDASGKDGLTTGDQADQSGRAGGTVSLYDVTFPTDTVSVDVSGGDAYYLDEFNNGVSGGKVRVVDSTVGTLNANGGDAGFDADYGSGNGTWNGGSAGTITQSNSTVTSTNASAGESGIPGCMDDSYSTYNDDATYDDGTCANLEIGTERDNPVGNTVTSATTSFWAFSNYGIVDGDAIFDARTEDLGDYEEYTGNYGTTTGYAVFNDTWGGYYGPHNYGYVGGGAEFNSYYGRNYGVIDGGATFDCFGDSAVNNGTINGDVTFTDCYTTNYGTIVGNVTAYGGSFAQNEGEITGDIYATSSVEIYGGGIINGDIESDYYFYIYSGVINGDVVVGNDGYVESGATVNGDFTIPEGYNSGTINGNADFGNNGYNYGTVNGNATFYDSSYNQGTVTGVVSVIYGCMDSDASNYDATAQFDDGSCTYYGSDDDLPEGTTLTGDLTFSSGYDNYGTVNGNVIFEDGSCNYGTVNGDATFEAYTQAGSGFYIISSFTAPDYCGTGVVTGSVYDVNDDEITTTVFTIGYDSDYVLSTDAWIYSTSTNDSTIYGDVVFYENSHNTGTIIGDATFDTTYYASTSPENGVFAFEDYAWTGSVSGTVYGSDSDPITLYEFYNSLVNTGTINGDAVFHDSSRNNGTINGDVTINSTYYSGAVPTTSTLSVSGSSIWSGTTTGDIFASDGTTEITGFNFSGTSQNQTTITSSETTIFSGGASNNGVINGDARFDNTSAFTVGTVNGTVTMNGISQTIQGVNSVVNFVKELTTAARDTLFFTAGSTLNVSGLFTLLGYDANNLLTIRSTTPNIPALLGVNGTNNFDFLRIKDITNTGSTVDLSSQTAYNDGGNTGFTFPSNSSPGQRTGGLTSSFTPPSAPSGSGTTGTTGTNTGGSSPGSSNILRSLFNNPGRTNLTPLPSVSLFGPGGSGAFNPGAVGDTIIPSPFRNFKPVTELVFTPTIPFRTNVSSFLFAPLPSTILSAISQVASVANILSAANINQEQQLAGLAIKPLAMNVSEEEAPAGHFVIKSGQTNLTTYASYDNGIKGVVQMVKVYPGQSIEISLKPLSSGDVTATYLDQTITFSQGYEFYSTSIITPSAPGRYLLRTASSPVPLLIEVEARAEAEDTPQKKSWGIWSFIWGWFN